MFDALARRYDLTNAVLSAGLDRTWRTAVCRAVGAGSATLVLDLAAGTGTSSRALAATGARVVACDFSVGMLAVARRRLAGGRTSDVALVAGDALRLPFAGGSFDAVSISFGLRNVADPKAALAELRRVTRPGGTLVVCEFSRPVRAGFRMLYERYLADALPALAHAVAANPEAYTYLAESIRAWPDQAGVAALLAGAGWTQVAWRNLTGGIVALHRASAPGAGDLDFPT